MKKLVCLIVSAAVLIAAVGCKKSASYEKFRIGKVTAYAEETVADDGVKEGFYDFTVNLFRTAEGENALFAPLPLYAALGMAVNGAAGTTREEMLSALGNTAEGVGALNRSVLEEVARFAGETRVSLANSVWIEKEYGQYVRESYLDALAASYEPEIFSLPFDGRALRKINAWAYNKTGGKIKKVIDRFGKDDVMELIAALYIKGKWVEEGQDLGRKNFRNGNGSEGTASYFSGSSALYVSESAYAVKRVLRGGFYLLAVLPKAEDGFDGYRAALTGAELARLTRDEDPRGAVYEFPAFENETVLDLEPALQSLGMREAFSSAADFTEMTTHPDGLYVSSVEQRAKIRINRFGLEGAATVRIGMAKSAAPPEEEPLRLAFDRPFFYFVCTPGGVPLLAGTVTKL